MSAKEWTYLIFGIVLLVALVFDLGLFSKSHKIISLKQALIQTCFWIGLSLAFGVFIWFEDGHNMAVSYLSAYLMEWSLSIDNIFVFIIIFNFFKIDEHEYGRTLLIGILIAIVLRIIFITVGVAIVSRFHWVLYFFGAFLVYTGFKMFISHKEDEVELDKNPAYRFIKKYFRITDDPPRGKYSMKKNGKRYFTSLMVVVVILGITDLVFSLDSIPAVFSITQVPMLIYTSNIFAVLGLRSLFFLLKGAANKFQYLQHGIAIILIFIGLKMLVEIFQLHIPIIASLAVIVFCLAGSILLSLYKNKRTEKESIK